MIEYDGAGDNNIYLYASADDIVIINNVVVKQGASLSQGSSPMVNN
jgi:hypothetical protein